MSNIKTLEGGSAPAGQDYDVDQELPHGYEYDFTGKIVEVPEALVQHDGHAPHVFLSERPELWPVFLETYATTGRLTAACAAIRVSRDTVMRLAASNQEFARAMQLAHTTYAGRIHAEFQRRALVGVTVPVFGKEGKIGTVQKYSDDFLKIELRRVSPEFRELLAPPKLGQTTVNVNATSSSSAQVMHNTATAIGALAADQHAVLRTLDPRTLSQAQRAALRVLLTTGTDVTPGAAEPEVGPASPRALCAAQGGQDGGAGERGAGRVPGAAGVLDVEAQERAHAATTPGVAPEASNLPVAGRKP